MTSLYVPVFRVAVNYVVNFGRRWSVLEQMLLLELASGRHSVRELARKSLVPDRLVVEGLINLMRVGWIEVRSTSAGNFFTATTAGKRRAADESLPSQLQRGGRWISLCFDRLSGSWLRADDLDLVYEKDLPENANLLEPIEQNYDPNDATIRDLLYLGVDEDLEDEEPKLRTPSRPYARIYLDMGELTGLPDYAPMRLREKLRAQLIKLGAVPTKRAAKISTGMGEGVGRASLDSSNFIVGGEEHFEFIQSALRSTKSYIAFHSCFVHPETVKRLLPSLSEAARRGVKVDLLWGLRVDAEDPKPAAPIGEVQQLLAMLPQSANQRIQLSPNSSGSHAKIIIFDDKDLGWTTVVGSCNYLSSWYSAKDVSLRTTSRVVGREVVGQLISAQVPSAGSWPAVARRLRSVWQAIRSFDPQTEAGEYSIELLVDEDHYACITRARDEAKSRILIGCDLFGLAAETSVVVPMEVAARDGCRVELMYNRPSKTMTEQGRAPSVNELAARGLELHRDPSLHGKFLIVDNDTVAVTSFNWLSTSVSGARSRGAELGLHVRGPGVGSWLAEKLTAEQSAGSERAP
ncbi:phospholipase D-like domain-containing protein [Mesorhizobium sp. STM 4661]|uniref:phospholipase D-like domain-containing protein n=1 Tax=Mesorhizobium sp. STM 4661 TaxID=1297570 RepID=UPI0002BF842E|nr:phospholipase D-like domain-containing protein [Mesorhizobium sp. STM 4661]CCV11478.1 hypothetical protein MESS4_330027 [Mesorhizobium sp. STM 4661]